MGTHLRVLSECYQMSINMTGSAGNRSNFEDRALAEIAERLIDYNRLFGSLPEVNYHSLHTPPKREKNTNSSA